MTGFWYLATPYSKYRAGTEAAYRDACALAAHLFRAGVQVYSPIAHTHAIAEIGGLAGHFERWAAFDEAMIRASDGLIVAATMDGWRESAGIAAEIAICERLRKPVHYYTGATLNIATAQSSGSRSEVPNTDVTDQSGASVEAQR